MDPIEHIYIHVPFCKKKCAYCDFYSIPVDLNSKNLFEEYAEAVISELNSNSPYLEKGSVKTVYIGGGSPVLLGPENLERIMDSLAKYLSRDYECTIEMNPEHFENNPIKKLKGINRISIGVQSSIERLLKNIGRTYSKDLLSENIKTIKKSKIVLSLDLMFALPGQTIEDLNNEIDFIISTKAEHLSYYMFTPPKKEDWENIPEDQTIAEMFKVLHNRLETANYSHYEISNYAKPGFECAHNSAYWFRKSYLGIGAGAHGYFKERKMRYWNLKDVQHYMDYENKMHDFEILDAEAERAEEIMLGMRMLKHGVNLDLVNKSKLNMLTDKKLIKLDQISNTLTLSEDGLALLNPVVQALL